MTKIAGAMVGTGGLLLAISGAATAGAIAIPAAGVTALAIAGVAVGGSGSVLYVLTPTKMTGEAFLALLNRFGARARMAVEKDYGPIYAIASREFSAQVSPEALMKRWHRKNQDAFWVIERRLPKRKWKVIGYFGILPLTRSGEEALIEGRTTGASISHTEVAKRFRNAAALYVAGIVCNGFGARGLGILAMTTRLGTLLEGRPNMAIYSTPASKRGVRLARDYGCEPVDPTKTLDVGVLCRVNGGSLRDRLRQSSDALNG